MDIQSATGDQLFSILTSRNSYSGIAGSALSRGIASYQARDYEGAVKEFRRAIGLDPYSENALQAYDFMAQAYLKIERIEEAEKTYKEAIRLFPTVDSFRLKLGNLYYSQQEYNEAEAEFLKAVRLNPSSENLYSLGQLYLATERYREAEDKFLRILKIEPKNYGALYSLGQAHSRQGLYKEAIERFEEAINIKRDFAYAYYDLGAAYADMGEIELAQRQATILDSLNQGLAEDLRAYIYKIRRPEISFVNTFNAFDMQKGPGTPLSSLDPALTEPNSLKDFSIKIYFDKMMDRASVENLLNWSITRATGSTIGGMYNWGLPIPDTEAVLNPFPKQVIYNSDEFSATVIFTLRQNSTGNGTIDPSHLVFKFSGRDAYGNAMNPSSDEYIGLSIIV